MALGADAWSALRRRITELLAATASESTQRAVAQMLISQRDAEMQLPAEIGDYTDFYASIHHATRVGKLFRPDNPLLPNYKYVPIGYHGRSSSIVVSGQPIRRPWGQAKPPQAVEPFFGPARNLDYELEIGIFIGPGNPPRRADPHRESRAARLRPLSRQRLVCARHPVLGVPAARAVSRQKLCHHHLAVDRAA